MATKEKINLLEVIPCRNEHIKAEQEGETIVLSFPRFKRSWMSRYLLAERPVQVTLPTSTAKITKWTRMNWDVKTII